MPGLRLVGHVKFAARIAVPRKKSGELQYGNVTCTRKLSREVKRAPAPGTAKIRQGTHAIVQYLGANGLEVHLLGLTVSKQESK